MRILFMGTPDFAVPSLRALDRYFTVCGVVTQPDRPRGRGYVLSPPPVKAAALSLNIPVWQPETLRDRAIESVLEETAPDMIVVVAYGKILPPYVLEYPRLGCVNVHASLLPAYRGAAPMQRAVMNGDAYTGVTTMYMAQGLDTGDTLELARLSIGENDDLETVHDRLAALGAALIVSTVSKLGDGTIHGKPQDGSKATYAAKITAEDCRIDFSENALSVHNRVRALSPAPLAFTALNGKMLKIVRTRVQNRTIPQEVPGRVLSLQNGEILAACGTGTLSILEVLPEGKKRMSSADFINGRKISVGDVLTLS